MPLTAKGNEILAAMKKEYGDKKGEEVFYASKNAGKITGVDSDERADAGYEIWEDPELKDEKYRFFVVNKGTKLPAITKSFASREEAERKKKELESRGDGLPPDSDVNPINLGIDCDAVQTKLDSMAEQINSLGSRAAGILKRMDAEKYGEKSYKALAENMVRAENDMIDMIAKAGNMSSADARRAFLKLKEVKALKLDAIMGRYTVKHGGFWEPDVLRRAAGLEK